MPLAFIILAIAAILDQSYFIAGASVLISIGLLAVKR
jgi:hypothetical protein